MRQSTASPELTEQRERTPEQVGEEIGQSRVELGDTVAGFALRWLGRSRQGR
jgi:hypothetical protein